jgi:site-specific recombinase XerC
MINRTNWLLTKAYLEYRKNVDLIAVGSIKTEYTHLRYILEWADGTPFIKAIDIRPSLPDYLIRVRLDGEGRRLSPAFIKKTLSTGRMFFTWVIGNNAGYGLIKRNWISTLKLPRRLNSAPKLRDAVSLEEIKNIAVAHVDCLIEERIRAAAVFWFLTGIRIGAFVTLPLVAVDIENKVIYQNPDLGVKTKNGKYGKSYLLDIPELLAVVIAWDKKVRAVLPGNGFWFAPFTHDTGIIDISCSTVGEHRVTLARKNLRDWLRKVGLPYHSPHKFRHGHIHYGLERSKTVADYKAVSMNVMHSSMDITDETYSNLDEQDIKSRIGQLGQQLVKAANESDNVFALFQEFLEWKKTNK